MLTIIIRTLIIYVIVTVAVRIMGKRQVSDMQTSELVITLIVSEIASLPLENPERPLLTSLVPIMIIVAIEIVVSLIMLKSRRLRALICGHPIVVIKDGVILESQLRRLRISYEDVYSLLRQQQISDPEGIRYGIIEPNGSMSVITAEDDTDGEIESSDLKAELDEAKEAEAEQSKTEPDHPEQDQPKPEKDEEKQNDNGQQPDAGQKEEKKG